MPIAFYIYRFLTYLLTPLIWWHINGRARKKKEDQERLNERWGQTTHTGFSTSTIWIHAASVGETVAGLTLIEMIHGQIPDQKIILTTGTMTSANIVEQRCLSKDVIHQYAPYDHPVWINRFINRWRPTIALRIESELWPNTLHALKQRGIKTALFNGRLSLKSFNRWRLFPNTIQYLLSSFHLILADGDCCAQYFKTLGAQKVFSLPNIKFLATAPKINPSAFNQILTAIGSRPVWLYASTHSGEEILAAHIHQKLQIDFPNLLTIILPRHPERRTEINLELSPYLLSKSLSFRGQNDSIKPETQLYIADTLGELMMFYAAVPVAVIGRSFSNDGGGGHNPIEPALMGCYPLSGPAIQNLKTIFDTMIECNAVEILSTHEDLTDRLRELFYDQNLLNQKRQQAQKSVTSIAATTYTELLHHVKEILTTEST